MFYFKPTTRKNVSLRSTIPKEQKKTFITRSLFVGMGIGVVATIGGIWGYFKIHKNTQMDLRDKFNFD